MQEQLVRMEGELDDIKKLLVDINKKCDKSISIANKLYTFFAPMVTQLLGVQIPL